MLSGKKTDKGAEMKRKKSWCYVGPDCEDGKMDEDDLAKWAYCRKKGPAYTTPIGGHFPSSFGNSLEYKCWPGYTLDGSPGGKTKLTTTVAPGGYLFPPLPESCKMITFTICGTIRDARNARGIGGVKVEAKGKSVTTWRNGFYRLRGIMPGTTVLKVGGGNFIPVEKEFVLRGNTHCEGVGAVKLSPKMADNEWRAVLSWGRRPSDLDTHVYWGSRKTIWYSRGMNWGYGMGVKLEKDDVSSYGPETMFFKNTDKCNSGRAINCDLAYKIKDYGRGGVIKSKSQASVILYHGDHVEGEWAIKDATNNVSPDKNWWHVFTIDGKTNTLKWHQGMGGGFLQKGVKRVPPENTTGYDGYGPFPRLKWKRRSQRDPELAKVRRAMFQTSRSTKTATVVKANLKPGVQAEAELDGDEEDRWEPGMAVDEADIDDEEDEEEEADASEAAASWRTN